MAKADVLYEAIDWRRPYESLDKELQQITPNARIGRRLADKLFKVWRKDGQEGISGLVYQLHGSRYQFVTELVRDGAHGERFSLDVRFLFAYGGRYRMLAPQRRWASPTVEVVLWP